MAEDVERTDVELSLLGLGPSQVSHVAAVLSRVASGLTMEGYPVCLHMQPSVLSDRSFVDEEYDHE